MKVAQKSNSSGSFSKSRKIGDNVLIGTTYGSVFDLGGLEQKANVKGIIASFPVKDNTMVNIGDIICYIEDGTPDPTSVSNV